MVLPIAAGTLIPTLTELAPLAGLFGGGGKSGDVNVSQNASNSTGISLTTILTNQSDGDTQSETGSTASVAAGSTASSQPNQPSGSIGIPSTITGSAASNITKGATSGTAGLDLDTPTLLGIGAILALGSYFLTRKRKRK